ncbi:MAG: PPC domain-containing protein [Pseudomonadota bacterium]
MRRSYLLAAAGALALLTAAAQAGAQTAGSLRVGGQANGTLAAGDAVAADDAYVYDDFRFTARAGQRLEAIMRADAFDTYLEVYEDGAAGEPLASDDDGLGEGTNSRLRWAPDAAGTYVLRARTLGGLEGGSYRLSLQERPAARAAPRPTGIRMGGTARGSIGNRDPETDEGVRYDAFSFRGRAGDRIAIRMNSEAFDPIVRLGRMSGGEFQELASNDDYGGELNSYLVHTLDADGEYVIRAMPLGTGGAGAYTLSLSEGPPPPPSVLINLNDSIAGELTAEDGVNGAGLRADVYRITGTAGQRIRAEMTSDAFDTYLQLSDAEGASLAEDDDGAGEGTNSRLTFTLPADGDYLIEARAFSEDGAGAYTLMVTETAPERAPEALAFGATVQGEIGDEDSKDDSDRGFDAYVFSGVEGQRIQAVMRSGDFDTFLRIGSAGGEFEELANDDDGLGEGTDSRLNFTLPATGDYVLRASPLGEDSDGLYALELIDRGPEPTPGSILIGSTARGTLAETDASAEDGSFYDAYRFDAKKGDTLIVTMVSNEADAFLTIGRDNEGGTFEALASDDDSLSDTHAKLEWEVPDDGAYVLRAGSFGQGETGAYAVTIARKP